MHVSVQENSVVRVVQDPIALTGTQLKLNQIVEFVTVKLFFRLIERSREAPNLCQYILN